MKSYWHFFLLIHRCVWQDWKHGRGQIGKATPKYKAEPADETPVIAELPSFGVCKIQDECLVIPHEIRSQYLSDPSRNHEWRKLLKEFDHKWGENDQTPNRSTTPAASPSGSTAPAPGSEPGPSPRCLDGDLNGATFDWASVFPDSPTTRTDMETKFPTGRHQFTMDGNLVGVIIEGTETTDPQLYIMATGDGSVETDTPVLTFGAGTWLLDGKAESFMQDRWFNERSKNLSIWFKQNLCFGTSALPENTHHQISHCHCRRTRPRATCSILTLMLTLWSWKMPMDQMATRLPSALSFRISNEEGSWTSSWQAMWSNGLVKSGSLALTGVEWEVGP